MLNKESVDAYLRDGCGRCDRYQTPDCKVHRWAAGLRDLRALLRQTELREEMKWGGPCYTLNGRNIILITAMNDYYALSFLQGGALADPDGALEAAGPNSHIARLLRFTDPDQVRTRRDVAVRLIDEAVAAAHAGVRVERSAAPEPVPDELAALIASDAGVAAAWDGLTPGRRRSHVLYVAGAKQAATRARRAEACRAKIVAGLGFLDR